MIKEYRSGGGLGFTVMVDGMPKRICFSVLSSGRGIYTTNDKKVQEAMEKDSWFGQKFYLSQVIEDEKPQEPEKETSGDAEETVADEMEVKTFGSAAEARDYLVGLGASGNACKTIAKIKEAGLKYGVKIEIG